MDLLNVMEIQAGEGEPPLSARSVHSVGSEVSSADQDTPLCHLYSCGVRSPERSSVEPLESGGG